MNWLHKDWLLEDEAYYPKRKVNNRGSQHYPHIIGSFYSQRNQRTVEFESLNERMFYYFLELDPKYYVQPIRVLMNTDNKEWFHVPDVLVFRQGSKPLLYQIKESQEDIDPNCDEQCNNLALQYNWIYDVVFPKKMPDPLPRNINFLRGFLKVRHYYPSLIQPVTSHLRCLGPITVEHLSKDFRDTIDPLFVKPLIYHLMAKGIFHVDVSKRIGSESVISYNDSLHGSISIGGGVAGNDWTIGNSFGM